MNPTFSRRHYQEIAKVINKSGFNPLTKDGITNHLIVMFKTDNPRFDESRFLRACTIVDFKEEK